MIPHRRRESSSASAQAVAAHRDRPGIVSVHLWTVPTRRVPTAIARMAIDRSVRRQPGVGFAKLLGTGSGQSFGPRDADLHRWGLLATWSSEQSAEEFEASATITGWDRIAHERLRVLMRPLSSRGSWSGRQPFGEAAPAAAWAGPVAAVTRARLRWRSLPRFLAASPPVAAALWQSPGLHVATGIGEAPLGLWGTFSLWNDAEDLKAFAYHRPEHLDVLRRTPREGWYLEELFARFGVISAIGTFAGQKIDVHSPRH